MPRIEKLRIFELYKDIFNYELSKIPEIHINSAPSIRAEDIAKEYFTSLGYEVFKSKVNGGYRVIGVEFYWKKYKDKISDQDRKILEKLRGSLTEDEFHTLADAVKEKYGTPDLLLLRDGKISFVEVKSKYETVKHPTIEFYIKYGDIWNLSIARVL